jgi:hypothetical protein
MDPTLLQRPRQSENDTDEHDEHHDDTALPPAAELRDAVELETETQELRELEPAAAQPPFTMKFEPPVEFDGKKFDHIRVDFDSMTGNDFMRCERKFQSMHKPEKNETVVMPEMKPLYHLILVECASNVPLGLLRRLPAKYYKQLRAEALKACGSSPDEEKE